ncbi:MAG: LysR family transcriptional regulator [Sneathiella sp.]
MRNIDTQLLRTFRTTAATGNMTQASAMLNLSQGAVSQQIRKLEEQLDCTLFNRQKSGLTMTAAGEKLFSKAQKLLAINDEIWQEMTQSNYSGTLTLGVPLDLMSGKLPSILRLFAENYPSVGFNLVCAPTLDLQKQFKDGQLDLTLMEELTGNVSGETLFTDQLVWIGAQGGTVREVSPLPISIASDACVFRLPTITALDEIGRPWKRVYESNNLDAILAMIRMDLAVGVFLSSLVPKTLEKIPQSAQFPALPEFHITLSLASGPRHEIAALLAGYIQRGFSISKAA